MNAGTYANRKGQRKIQVSMTIEEATALIAGDTEDLIQLLASVVYDVENSAGVQGTDGPASTKEEIAAKLESILSPRPGPEKGQ